MPIFIRAEPWAEYREERWGYIDFRQNRVQAGCFTNHDHLIQSMLKTEAERFMILQDDFIYHPDCFEKVKDAISFDPNAWYFCFHTNTVYEPAIKKEWRNRLDVGFWIAFQVSYLMNRETLKAVVEHEFYQNHLHTYIKNEQVDACISETLKIMWKPMYYHNPSLSIHIGAEHSTLGHPHRHNDDFTYFPVK